MARCQGAAMACALIRCSLHVLLQAGALQVHRATNRPDAGRNYAALYEQLSRRRDEVLTVAAQARYRKYNLSVLQILPGYMQGDTQGLQLHGSAALQRQSSQQQGACADPLGQSVIADLRARFEESAGPSGDDAGEEPAEEEQEEAALPRATDPLRALGLTPQQHTPQGLPHAQHRKHRGYQPTSQSRKRRTGPQAGSKSGGYGGSPAKPKRFAIREPPAVPGQQGGSRSLASLLASASRQPHTEEEAVSDTEEAAVGVSQGPAITAHLAARTHGAPFPQATQTVQQQGPDVHREGPASAHAAAGNGQEGARPSAAAQDSPGGMSAQRRFLAAALQDTPLPKQQVCMGLCRKVSVKQDAGMIPQDPSIADSLSPTFSSNGMTMQRRIGGRTCACAQAARQGMFTSPKRHGASTLSGQLDRLVQHEANQLGLGHAGDTMQVWYSVLCTTVYIA